MMLKFWYPFRTLVGIFLLLAAILFSSSIAYTPKQSPSRRSTPFIRKQDMIGIWRLTHQKLSLPITNDSATKTNIISSSSKNDDDETYRTVQHDIVIRLNDDGSFDPYTTAGNNDQTKGFQAALDKENKSDAKTDLYSLKDILSRGGSWTFRDGSLILAPDRPEDNDNLGTQVHDTLLAGRLNVQVSECMSTDPTSMSEVDNQEDSSTQEQEPEIDVHLSIPSGDVKMGKFMYPRRHKAFFDEPMLFPESSIGTFAMKQLLGNLNARLKQEQKEEESNPIPPKFDRKDFYDRQFYLTATPHAVNPALAAQDKHYKEENVQYDVRVMPTTFHSNNTFTAIGTEKILRGRFGITGEEGHKLWFQVNLFGFGRSAPGSVYSEGRLLSHDDKRGYLGTIQEYQGGINNRTMYFVEGEFYYGTDLKRTNKAHSWGSFSLQEVDSVDDQVDVGEDEEEEEDDDEKLENLFKASDSDISVSPLDGEGEDAFQ